MRTIFLTSILALFFLVGCSENSEQQLKNIVHLKLEQSNTILDTLNCQAAQTEQVAIYRDLVKDLNVIIETFVDTSETQKIPSQKDLERKVDELNAVYHSRLDSSVKSVDYKLFRGEDSMLMNTSFFKVSSSAGGAGLSCYSTYVKILDEHLNIIKMCRPTFSHGCEAKKTG